jgi:flavin reductase (DIM6/NTAB) family NADH-FMN oxidoreductase RutF
VNARALRDALGQYATGVTVVTARAGGGRPPVGLTVNSFTSVSLNPPLVLWCVRRDSPSLLVLRDATHVAVHVLAARQRPLADRFARGGDDKFAGLPTAPGLGGAPLLPGTLARFECRLVDLRDAGDHVIATAEVERYAVTAGAPLVFHDGRFVTDEEKVP